jgi:EAL domain-containing protein (putative c-di-GMP-specific phosphodiesterase class I)
VAHSRKRDASPSPDRLRAALAAGHVTPHYQPIVDIRSGRILQFEALARWPDQERGFIPPSEFIRVAERSGLVREITSLMIGRALADIGQWQTRLPGLRVAVNLSAESLAEPHLPEAIGRALAASGCSEGCLSLEVTESVLMARPEVSRGHIERLRAVGVHVAIDDFGTGFSSLRYLQLLPVDSIKIDRQFIETSVEDRNSQIIVRSVVALCHELGFEVVGEGVAESDVWDLLAALSCDGAQGYFVARPMPPASVGAWIEEWQRTKPATTQAPAADARAHTPLVLVVDDEPTIVALVEGILVERGYRVRTALNGQEALEAVDRDQPDLVLLEMRLPIVDGEGFVAELRARRIDVPVVIMTAGPSAVHWARKLKVEGAIAKPFQLDQLIAAVERFAAVH